MAVNTTKFPVRGASSQSTAQRKPHARSAARHPSDDEILGLVTSVAPAAAGESPVDGDVTAGSGVQAANGAETAEQTGAPAAGEGNSTASSASGVQPAPVPPELVPILEANPQLLQAWEAAHAYEQVFATPAAARDAQQQLSDLDGMFFSAQPSDHAALAARIHELSPEAFHGLAQAMQAHAAKVADAGNSKPANDSSADAASQSSTAASNPIPAPASHDSASQPPQQAAVPQASEPHSAASPTPENAAKAAFFHDTNAAAVEQILGAIHSQVDRLLPDSIGAGARNRIVGEIYRELDSSLRANRQLGKQLREAFQSGPGDAAHQRAIVTLVAGRARQALPAVAKRVIGEWTQSIIAANRERLGRHEAASKRVDISGAGPSDGVNRKPVSPRDINYRRLSDADILNL